MAENTLLTRIQLKYDTFANWESSSIILKKGEVAIAEVPSETTGSKLMPPAIGIKVGDGAHLFRQLPWIQAAAGDVYQWAKAPDVRSVPGLRDYIIETAGNGGSGGGGLSLQYRIIKGGSIEGDTTHTDTNKYYLQSSTNGTDWVDTPYELDFTGPETRLAELEEWSKAGLPYRMNLGTRITNTVNAILDELDYSVAAPSGTFVTNVTQTDGKIAVTRSTLKASDISEGVLNVDRGGTGLNSLDSGKVLIGNGTSAVTFKSITDSLSDANRTSTDLITATAVYAFVSQRLGALANAMRFIGRASVPVPINTPAAPGVSLNPSIPGYDFANARAGDVILVEDNKELVWDSENKQWLLLGQDGDFVIRGSITAQDLANDFSLPMSKITDLETELAKKVDKSNYPNPYTTEEKNKLDGIEEGAQVNKIEHINLNVTSDGVTTSTSQVINPNTKTAEISLDLSNMGKVAGAKIPNGASSTDIPIDPQDKKLQFARIAGTGDVADLVQTSQTILVLNCGSATEVITDATIGS